jgi:hypothetical protein
LNIGIPDRATTAAPSPKPTGAPAPTARQAKAAINAMVAPVGKSKSRTRQIVLAGIALLLLVPLAGVFLFGDSLFQTPSLVNVAATTAASTSVPQAAAGNVTVQAVPTTVGAGSLTAALPEPVANLADFRAPAKSKRRHHGCEQCNQARTVSTACAPGRQCTKTC